MKEIFQVGLVCNPQPDDREFSFKDAAENYALVQSENDRYSDFGVWRKDDGELLSIAFQGELFTK